ncbi:DUF7249 family protein [Dokdonella sp.]|uniref:DUF7249 family protein n=1 Tax=Dokdonella sp. TaxID=2291710 RepID=UPI0031BD276C|nr:hypothetical protein [Dokdonella sp.]
MTQDRTYNGWRNRDTWGANLWLANDEGTYRQLYGRAADMTTDEFEAEARELLDALGNPDEIEYGNVDWEEVRLAFAEE